MLEDTAPRPAPLGRRSSFVRFDEDTVTIPGDGGIENRNLTFEIDSAESNDDQTTVAPAKANVTVVISEPKVAGPKDRATDQKKPAAKNPTIPRIGQPVRSRIGSANPTALPRQTKLAGASAASTKIGTVKPVSFFLIAVNEIPCGTESDRCWIVRAPINNIGSASQVLPSKTTADRPTGGLPRPVKDVAQTGTGRTGLAARPSRQVAGSLRNPQPIKRTTK